MPDTANGNTPTKGVKARLLARGFDVLFCLGEHPEGAKLVELSTKSGLSRATVLRILRTLIDLDVVSFDARDKLYRFGPAFYRLNAMAMHTNDVARIGQPFLDGLRDETGETVCLFQRRRMERICVASAMSQHDLGLRIEPGQIRPLMAGGPGRILVAYLSAEESGSALKTLSRSERKSLNGERVTLRATGILVTHDEIIMGATSIARPIFNGRGSVETSLAVIGPTARLTDAKVVLFTPLVRDAGEHISLQLGWSGEGSSG